MTTATYDLVVIGAGPGGYVCAIRAAQLGLSVACIEKRSTLGGTCLNIGCIPSKALLESSELFHRAQHEFAKHGIDASPTISIGAMSRKDKIVSQLTRGIEGLFKDGITSYQGHGRFAGPGQVEVVGEGGSVAETLSAAAVVIATGSEVSTLPGIEIDGDRVVGSTEALSLEEPQST